LLWLGLLLCCQLLGTTRPSRGRSAGGARSPLSTCGAVAIKHGGGGSLHGLHALKLTSDTTFGQRALRVAQRAIQAGPCYVSVPARDADSDEEGSWGSGQGSGVTATTASSYASYATSCNNPSCCNPTFPSSRGTSSHGPQHVVGRSPPGKRAAARAYGGQLRRVQHGGKIHLQAVDEQQQQAGQGHEMSKSVAPTASRQCLSRGGKPVTSGEPNPLNSSRVKAGGKHVGASDDARQLANGDTKQGDCVHFRSVPVKFLWAGKHATVAFTGRVPTVQALAVELARLGSSKLGCELKASEMKIESKQRDRVTGGILREAVLPSTDLTGIRHTEALLISSW